MLIIYDLGKENFISLFISYIDIGLFATMVPHCVCRHIYLTGDGLYHLLELIVINPCAWNSSQILEFTPYTHIHLYYVYMCC